MTSLQILTQEEVKIFNAVPVLSNSEQKYYFKIPNNLLENIETNMNQIYFIALFGYFKKANKFFEKFDNQIYLYIAQVNGLLQKLNIIRILYISYFLQTPRNIIGLK